jgi:hypothetical protein
MLGYCPARPNTRWTLAGCHWPPRGVKTPRSFNAFANWRALVIPVALMSWIVTSTSKAHL